MSKFKVFAGMNVSSIAKQVEGSNYLPWATAVQLAGNPGQRVVTTGTGVVREIFGGAVVSVDQATEGGTIQRTTLVITDAKGNPMPYAAVSSKDAGNTINRCRARAIATVAGLGISLYSQCGVDGPGYVAALDVHPDTSDLRQVPPLIEEKKDKKTGRVLAEYLGWFSALSAARITDPNFFWEPLEFEAVDRSTGEVVTLPAQQVPGKGWLVAVRTVWQGREHVEWLPIMGVVTMPTRNGPKPLDYQALEAPNASDWHKSVMRALAKGIAISTGYGIELYADELDVADAPITGAPADVAAATVLATKDVPTAALIEKLKALLVATDTPEPKALSFLRANSIETAALADVERTVALLEGYCAKQHA